MAGLLFGRGQLRVPHLCCIFDRAYAREMPKIVIEGEDDAMPSLGGEGGDVGVCKVEPRMRLIPMERLRHHLPFQHNEHRSGEQFK